MRYFFEIAYHGHSFAGWQSQKNALGIQAVVEDGLTKIFRMPLKILGSGRTDTGVHCEQQFFHADIEKEFEVETLIAKLNSFLPQAIAIKNIQAVNNSAHARFDAYERSYEYRITKVKNPFLQGMALHHFKPLDIQTMNKAAVLLVGIHDFTSFSKVKTDVNNFLCEVKKASWKEDGDSIIFSITANRFLRGMVRAIVGTLLDVGSAKLSVHDFKQIINSKDRRNAGANVAPHGLFLTKVKYPPSIYK